MTAIASPEVIAETNTNEVAAPEPQPMELILDEFGRDEAERTVMLSSADAEAVDKEVTAGKHDTYDEALAYVISRGLAEIKRTRDAQEARRGQQELAKRSALYEQMLKVNPALVTDANFVQKMVAELVTRQKAK